jgi:hypothetical protein
MAEQPFTDAELEAACKAVHELEDMTADRHLSVRHEVAAALWAVLPAHDARIRAQAGEDIARNFDNWATTAGDHGLDSMVEPWRMAARLARQVTRATGEEVKSQ